MSEQHRVWIEKGRLGIADWGDANRQAEDPSLLLEQLS